MNTEHDVAEFVLDNLSTDVYTLLRDPSIDTVGRYTYQQNIVQQVIVSLIPEIARRSATRFLLTSREKREVIANLVLEKVNATYASQRGSQRGRKPRQ